MAGAAVIWTVPGFTVDRYRPQLALLHRRIQADGSFTARSQRFLIEAGKPGASGLWVTAGRD
jgi:hypothetical protein